MRAVLSISREIVTDKARQAKTRIDAACLAAHFRHQPGLPVSFLDSNMILDRRSVLALMASAGSALAFPARAADWQSILADAKGKTVYFNAWGGGTQINAYIAWAGEEIAKRYGVTLSHVKLADTADAVNRIIGEAAAGNTDSGGSVDLIWINGKNFATLKEKALLHGPFTDSLPNFRFVDVEGNPTALRDFTTPVDGLEAPWGTARFVLVHDSAKDASPPKTLDELLAFAKANPGRFTYPQPPDFIGSTFLKQLLVMLAKDAPLAEAPSDAAFDAVAAPVFAYLDQIHPSLWREGKAFPTVNSALTGMMGNGELRLIMTFNPAMAANAVAAGELPESVRTYALAGGSIGNTHFLAIPKNSNVKAAAMVVADFMLSPEAQARKADIAVWGDPTVLSIAKLDQPAQQAFASAGHPALPDAATLGPMINEPHPGWGEKLEAAWAKRYAAG
jgi:putative thiamine transport system substrate-binding protein